MKSFGVRPTSLAIGLIIGASCISCSRHDASSQAAAAKHAKPGPEESFNVIAETFKRRIEQTPVGFVVSEPGERSTMSGSNAVTTELIRPTNDTEPYKAVITVVRESRYSIKRTKDPAEDKPRERNADAKGEVPLPRPGEQKVTPTFENGVSKPSTDNSQARNPPAARPTEDVIAPPPDHEVRKYELLYKEGHWTLVTELNKETEQSIENAFKNALETQG